MNALDFRPRLWTVLLVLVLSAVMISAGCWQYGKGVHKQQQLTARALQAHAPAQPLLADLSTPTAGSVRRVALQGRYVENLSVQLDNQPYQKQPGIHVWTPFILTTGEQVVVDRGWLPLNAPASPAPEGVQQITGNWRRLPEPGLRLGQASAGCASPRPERVNYPDLSEVRCLFGAATREGLLELAPDAAGGFGRDWSSAGSNEIPPSRHFAYAVQWWLFALTLVALFIKIKLRPKTP